MTGNRDAIQVLGFPESSRQAHEYARHLQAGAAVIGIHHFPDGESRVTLPTDLAPVIVLYRSLDRANEKLIELMLASATARAHGAQRILLVAPYVCYMRQDTAFSPGEAVSQQIVGALLAGLCDGLVTADPHLHRTRSMQDILPGTPCRTVSAAPLAGEMIAAEIDRPLLIGPDDESQQWVAAAAGLGNGRRLDYAVGRKVRRGDAEVSIEIDPGLPRGRDTVIVDDIASSGGTLCEMARKLNRYGATSVTVFITHALFAGDAEQNVRNAGVGAIWSADTVPHPTNRVSLQAPLAAATRSLLGRSAPLA